MQVVEHMCEEIGHAISVARSADDLAAVLRSSKALIEMERLMAEPGAVPDPASNAVYASGFADSARPRRKISKSRAEVSSISPCGSRTRGPESRHAWLINETVKAPLQFPKNRKMIPVERGFVVRQRQQYVQECRELNAASRIGLAILHLRED
jgi:hypothetical protein